MARASLLSFGSTFYWAINHHELMSGQVINLPALFNRAIEIHKEAPDMATDCRISEVSMDCAFMACAYMVSSMVAPWVCSAAVADVS